jgi:hypothetical protein
MEFQRLLEFGEHIAQIRDHTLNTTRGASTPLRLEVGTALCHAPSNYLRGGNQ